MKDKGNQDTKVGKLKNYSGQIFDDVFRTLCEKNARLLIPLINEIFKQNYAMSDKYTLLSDSHHLMRSMPQVDTVNGNICYDDVPKEKTKDIQTRITDSCMRLHDKLYHIECQSTPDGTMILRMIEYDFMIAMDNARLIGDTYYMEFPQSAVLYIRSTNKTPDDMNMHIAFANGEIIEYKVPIIKVKEYTLEYILEKKLYFLIPYYIMRYEKRIKNNDDSLVLPLEEEYQELFDMIIKDCEAGVITEYDRTNIMELMRKVAGYISRDSKNMKEKVGKIMGGRVLITLADRMLEKGLQQGAIKHLIKQTCKKLQKGKDLDEIIEAIEPEEYEIELIEQICELAEQLDYDVESICNVIVPVEEECKTIDTID